MLIKHSSMLFALVIIASATISAMQPNQSLAQEIKQAAQALANNLMIFPHDHTPQTTDLEKALDEALAIDGPETLSNCEKYSELIIR